MAGALVRALFLPGDRGRRAAARFRLYRDRARCGPRPGSDPTDGPG